MKAVTDFRRIVTGLDDQGRSTVVIDGPIPEAGHITGMAWRTLAIPADNSGAEDHQVDSFGLEAMHDGSSNFIIAVHPPGLRAPKHATDTIDYVIVISGEIVLELETGDVTARAGDFIVQRGIQHGWRNDGAVNAVMGFVTLPAHPVGAGRTTGVLT